MGSKANLFDSNKRKSDAKKNSNFFCPEYLDYVNHWEKLIFCQNKVG